jgi:hypothetical protein
VTHRHIALAGCVFLALALFVGIFAFEAGIHGSAIGIAAPLVFLGLVAGVAWRWTQVRVLGDARELLVRNAFLTYHIPREAIGGFRSGLGWELPWGPRPPITFSVAVRVGPKDGRTVGLLATRSYIYSFMSSAFPERHQKQLAQLQEWLRPDQPAVPTATA